MLAVLVSIMYIAHSYIKYIEKLQKDDCKCSEHEMREYVKYYSYYIIVVPILIILVGLIFGSNIAQESIENPIYKNIAFIVTILGTYVLYTYSKLLVDRACKCSEGWQRDTMKYHSYVLITIISLSFISMILGFLVKGSKLNGKNNSKNNSSTRAKMNKKVGRKSGNRGKK